MKVFYKFLFIATLAITSVLPSQGYGKTKCFEHQIQLQLSDSLGFPVPGTEFWVKLNILKEGNKVTIQLPVINFQTGPFANNPDEVGAPLVLPGGYLYTASGFLPEEVRPKDLVYRSWLAASNNGLSLPFSFTQDPSTLPVPPTGYIVQVTNAGALVIQCPGTFGNIIPTGPQILLPTDVTYIVKPRVKLKHNTQISTGATNTTGFTGNAAGDGIRDTHQNDAFDGVAGWAWCDNSNIADKTNNTLNAWVAIGTVKKGKIKVKKPIQLSDLAPGVLAWDTSVAINRTNKDNIVVSYGVIDNNPSAPFFSQRYRAVSFDGGETWPENGPINIQPTGSPLGFGDNLGVASDKYGNIWYSSTNFYTNSGKNINQPVFLASTDGGVTYELVYEFPRLHPPYTIGDYYTDYPQYCFGGDGLGNYGLWFQTTFYNLVTSDAYSIVGFIPIYGLGQFGTGTYSSLQGLTNTITETSLSASSDGRVWFIGPLVDDPGAYTYIRPQTILFKSPGLQDENYAGPWHFIMGNDIADQYFVTNVISQPVSGYFPETTTSIIYDETRQALYAAIQLQYPDYSQNMRIYFAISRDNGQTWSDPIDISNTDFANRGYLSMALDPVRGDLYWGWYDGRNDPTYQSIEYFGTVIPARQLDQLVYRIPPSNPLFSVPSAAEFTGSPNQSKLSKQAKKALKQKLEKKLGHLKPKRPQSF